jgi:hypothetical protein
MHAKMLWTLHAHERGCGADTQRSPYSFETYIYKKLHIYSSSQVTCIAAMNKRSCITLAPRQADNNIVHGQHPIRNEFTTNYAEAVSLLVKNGWLSGSLAALVSQERLRL